MQACGLWFVSARDFKEHSFWHDDNTKECIKQAEAVAS